MQTYDYVSGQIIGPVIGNGQYCKTADAQAALDERDREIAALTAEIEQWKRVVVTHVEEIERLKAEMNRMVRF